MKSEPGPSTMASASRIAEITSSSGAAAGGSKKTRLIGRFASEIFDSPSRIVPSSSSAQSRTTPSVAGSTRPTTLSTRLDSLIGTIEVSGDAAHRRQEKIAERVSAQPFPFGESIAEKIGNHCLVVGERDEAVANVARRQNAEFFLQAPRGAAVVADRYDRGRLLVRRLRPRSSVESPVPPPIATIL